jgi:hypothetical protein
LLQFTAKELLARGGAGMAGWEVEGQRGQRVDHAVAAHLLPVHGFHADDADDDFDGNQILLGRTLQRGAVRLPEGHSGANPDRVDEAATVDPPVLGGAGGRRQHQSRDTGQEMRLPDGLTHPVAVQVAARSHVVGPAHDVLARGIDRPLHRDAGRDRPRTAARLVF